MMEIGIFLVWISHFQFYIISFGQQFSWWHAQHFLPVLLASTMHGLCFFKIVIEFNSTTLFDLNCHVCVDLFYFSQI